MMFFGGPIHGQSITLPPISENRDTTFRVCVAPNDGIADPKPGRLSRIPTIVVDPVVFPHHYRPFNETVRLISCWNGDEEGNWGCWLEQTFTAECMVADDYQLVDVMRDLRGIASLVVFLCEWWGAGDWLEPREQEGE